MMRTIRAAVLGFVAAGTAAGAAPLSSWHGRYTYSEPLGRIGGSTPSEGAAAFVDYSLLLGPRHGPTGCVLRAQGFQTSQLIRCTATPQGGSVVIRFYDFEGDGVRRSYTAGQPLLTLTRTGRGLMTRFLGLTPASDRSPRTGRLFRRIG